MGSNHVCHIEFSCTDLARSQRFYGGLFNWVFRKFSDDMVVFGDGNEHIGGLMKTEMPSAGESPSIWIQVESIDAVLAKTEQVGGEILRGKTELPHVGFSAQVADPDGNRVGLVEYAS